MFPPGFEITFGISLKEQDHNLSDSNIHALCYISKTIDRQQYVIQAEF